MESLVSSKGAQRELSNGYQHEKVCASDKSGLSKLEGLRGKDMFFLGLPTFYFKPTHNAKKSTRVQCVESAAHALLGSVRHKGCLSYQLGKGTCCIYLITANETDTFRIFSLLYLNPTLHHNYASPDSIDTLSHCSPLDSANHRPVHLTDSHTNYSPYNHTCSDL